MSGLGEKFKRFDSLRMKAGWVGYCLFTYDDESIYTTARGLSFRRDAETEESRYGDGGCVFTGYYNNLIWVEETGLKVYDNGWLVEGPWQEIAEPALDELIERLQGMITKHETKVAREKQKAERARKKERDDLIARSKAAFGGK